YIADTNDNRIRWVDGRTGIITTVAGNGNNTYAGDGGAANNASLAFPAAVALDQNLDLFIADTNNARIRRVDAITGFITTFDGATGQLSTPRGVACDAPGNVYIADSGNNRIRRVDALGATTNYSVGAW